MSRTLSLAAPMRPAIPHPRSRHRIHRPALLFSWAGLFLAAAASAADPAPTAEIPESVLALVAADPATGQFGVAAVSSGPLLAPQHVAFDPEAGAAIFVAPPAPAIVKQLFDLLRRGRAPEKSLPAALAGSPAATAGGIGVVGRKGAAWAMPAADPEVAVRSGPGYAIVGSLLASPQALERMERVFLGAKGLLSARMLAALQAAYEDGAGRLPARSAVLRVIASPVPEATADPRAVDLRVDDHPFAVLALQGLARQWRTAGALRAAIEQGRRGEWGEAARTAARLAAAEPANPALHYQLALFLARAGETAKAVDALRAALRLEPGYRDLAASEAAFSPLREDATFREALAGEGGTR